MNPLTPAQILAESERVAVELLAPTADETDRLRRFPHKALEELGKKQILALMVPSEFGGSSGSLLEMAAVLETLAQGCASTAMVVLMHYCATALLATKASQELKESVLPAIARGEHLSTLAFSEPESGGHFYAPVSRARQQNSSIELNTFKSFVTSAGEADSYIVSTLNQDAVGARDLDLYFVPRSAAGVEPAGPFEGLGLAGNASGPLNFKEVLIPLQNRLGEEKTGLGAMLEIVLPHFQVGSAAVSVGIASTALQRTIDHVTARKYQHSSQKALALIPRVQFLVAEMTIELRSARAYLYETVRKAMAGEANAMLDILAVKAKAAEANLAVVSRAMTLGGGAAFGHRGGLERIFRDAQASAVMAPMTDVLKDFIGKAALGLPLFGDVES
ncbi:MAG: acyl-CoA dehydrogenase family protein [Silvibacterium sp.]